MKLPTTNDLTDDNNLKGESYIDVLPNEILLHIFELTVKVPVSPPTYAITPKRWDVQPWILSHVSQYWRDLSTTTPVLWSNVILSYGASHPSPVLSFVELDQRLSYASSGLLDMTLHFNSWDESVDPYVSKGLLRVLSTSNRWRSLWLHSFRSRDPMCTAIFANHRFLFPNLLIFKGSRLAGHTVPFQSTMFSHAPKLVHFQMTYCSFYYPELPWDQFLSIYTDDEIFLLHNISKCTKLKSVRMHNHMVQTYRIGFDASHPNTIHCIDTVEHFVVAKERSHHFLPALRFPSVTSLSIILPPKMINWDIIGELEKILPCVEALQLQELSLSISDSEAMQLDPVELRKLLTSFRNLSTLNLTFMSNATRPPGGMRELSIIPKVLNELTPPLNSHINDCSNIDSHHTTTTISTVTVAPPLPQLVELNFKLWHNSSSPDCNDSSTNYFTSLYATLIQQICSLISSRSPTVVAPTGSTTTTTTTSQPLLLLLPPLGSFTTIKRSRLSYHPMLAVFVEPSLSLFKGLRRSGLVVECGPVAWDDVDMENC